MGLGPPVCTKCERILDLMTEEEHRRRVEAGEIRPTSYLWWCSKCGGQIWWDEQGCTSHDPHTGKHLFELPPDTQERYRRN